MSAARMSRGPRVFLIDDDGSVCRALARLLAAAGFCVETFASALEFLQCALPGAGDCLLVDVQMPGMNGLELRDALRAVGCALPLIFMTACDGRRFAQDFGAEPVLFKPIEPDLLIRTVRAATAGRTELPDEDR